MLTLTFTCWLRMPGARPGLKSAEDATEMAAHQGGVAVHGGLQVGGRVEQFGDAWAEVDGGFFRFGEMFSALECFIAGDGAGEEEPGPERGKEVARGGGVG